MGDRRNKYGMRPDMQACPVETTLDVIGGKWKGIILYQLLDGTKRFNEFRRLNPGITQFMLTLQLRELERDGIIHRRLFFLPLSRLRGTLSIVSTCDIRGLF
ncbi:hypothetical protein YDYSG_38630 [Paenibacillus tyrfis]|nr:hypothetical protein YDYSG_38630 [Paenibacillus tyrfis]